MEGGNRDKQTMATKEVIKERTHKHNHHSRVLSSGEEEGGTRNEVM